jgi:predicted RNase H-like HicB family nuclease
MHSCMFAFLHFHSAFRISSFCIRQRLDHFVVSLYDNFIVKNMKSQSKILHLPILVEQDEDNMYIVSCPVFKGCHSYGKTIDEALANIREVIDICIDEIV